jgi:hypothetical protein
MLSFKVYFDRDYRYHKYRLATSRMPFAWVYSNSDGMHDVFFFNMGNTMHFSLYRWTLYLTIRMIYLSIYLGWNYAPSYVQMEVIDTLTQKYVNYYRQMHMNQNLTPSKHNGTERIAKTNTHEHQGRSCSFKTMYSMHGQNTITLTWRYT